MSENRLQAIYPGLEPVIPSKFELFLTSQSMVIDVVFSSNTRVKYTSNTIGLHSGYSVQSFYLYSFNKIKL